MTFEAIGSTVSTRSYFSAQYLWSAEHHANLAQEIENFSHQGESRFDIRHRAYVIDAITDSVAFLEAAINELLQDVADMHESYIAPLDVRARDRLVGYWVGAAERTSTVDKYDKVLQLTGFGALDRGSEPTQSADVLVKLRNYLVHYRPENVSTAFDPPRLASRLKDRRFADNRLKAGAGNAWFPDHALGAGCAAWAHETARAFADDWCSRVGLTPNYQLAKWDTNDGQGEG